MSSARVIRQEMPDRPYARPVPDVLVPVVADLAAKQAVVVTLDDLASYGTEGWSPSEMAQVLRCKGWLFPMRCRGAWQFYGYGGSLRTAGFEELGRVHAFGWVFGMVGGWRLLRNSMSV